MRDRHKKSPTAVLEEQMVGAALRDSPNGSFFIVTKGRFAKRWFVLVRGLDRVKDAGIVHSTLEW
jgi:hypothetical protein